MGKLVRSLREDIQQNWDLYSTMIFSLITLYLNLFNRANTTLVLSLTLIMLGFIAFSLRRERRIETEILELVVSKKKNRVFDYLKDAYLYLIEEIKKMDVDGKEAVLIQYSSRSCIDVVRTLLEKGAKVTVYIQEPAIPRKLGSKLQAVRTKDTVDQFLSDLALLANKDKLIAYYYKAPASVSGIKVDDQLICMGWYIYENVITKLPKYPNDTIEISSHDISGLVVWKGTDEYKSFDKTFCRLVENYNKANP